MSLSQTKLVIQTPMFNVTIDRLYTKIFNTLTAKDVILRPYFSFLYAEDVLIRLSAKFDFDRFSV